MPVILAQEMEIRRVSGLRPVQEKKKKKVS
jgi:hypothetical protein